MNREQNYTYKGPAHPPQKCQSHRRIWTPSNTWFRVIPINGILTGSAILHSSYMCPTHMQTDRQTNKDNTMCNICSNRRPPLCTMCSVCSLKIRHFWHLSQIPLQTPFSVPHSTDPSNFNLAPSLELAPLWALAIQTYTLTTTTFSFCFTSLVFQSYSYRSACRVLISVPKVLSL